jgi:4'-phosphopantetheinyl transferase superfamily protein
LTRGEVHVWLVSLPDGDPALRRDAARAALDTIAARYDTTARVVHRDGRRPVAPGSGLELSLARGGEIALVSVATGCAAGVDVEPIVAAPSRAVVTHLLTNREATALDALPTFERDAAFARSWVRKEAALKAVGVGLAVEPRLVEVGVEEVTTRLVVVPGHGVVTVADLDVPGYAAAVAVRAIAAPSGRLRCGAAPVLEPVSRYEVRCHRDAPDLIAEFVTAGTESAQADSVPAGDRWRG